TVIGGLVNNTLYEVVKIDDYRIKLRPIGFVSETVTVSGGQINNGLDRITVGNFDDDDFVTYRAPDALATFTVGQVNTQWNGSAWVAATNNVFFAIDATPNDDNDNTFADIPLANGERIFYTASDPAYQIGGLTSGNFYHVRRLSGQQFQFALSYCAAVGGVADPFNCTDPDGTWSAPDGNPDPHPIQIITLTPNLSAASKLVTHSIRRDEHAPISGLADGAGYYVVGCGGACTTFFQLSSTLGGSARNIDNLLQNGFGHQFVTEGVDITDSGRGFHRLVIDISPGSGTQQLVGIGGVGFAAKDGDGVISASATGGGGGAINVATAKANAKLYVTVSNTVETGATLDAAVDVNVLTDGYTFVKAIASNDGGGFISVGKAEASLQVAATNTLNVNSGASLTAQRHVLVRSRSNLQPTVTASGAQGGLGASSALAVTAEVDYKTETIVNGTVFAGDKAEIEARTSFAGTAKATSNVGGFGADGRASARIEIGSGSSLLAASAFTHSQLSGSANVTGRIVNIRAVVDKMHALADSYTRAIAFGAGSIGTSNITIGGSTETTLVGGATIVGNVATSLEGEYLNKDLYSYARSICRCFGGVTRPTAEIFDNTDARVVGRNGVTITTADLTVMVNQEVDRYDKVASRSGGFLDFGSANDGDGQGQANMYRRIFWESLVIMLGEPNPWLEVDALGNITKLINMTVTDDNGGIFIDDPFNNIHTVGQLSGSTITVADIIYDRGANARFLANAPGSFDGESTPDGVIWGRGGVFEFQQTWDFVKLINNSQLNLVTNIIDVVNDENSPVIEIRVDNIPPGTGVNAGGLNENGPMPSFDFDIKYTFPPTLVLIQNLWPAGGPFTPPFIRLDGYIENPIGTTRIENLSGDILSGPGAEVIRTNILDLYAPQGTIGVQGPPRNAIIVELVRWQDMLGDYHPIMVEIDAGI
ncbi:MAG: hypothetical protein OEO77_14805, partial [Acidimicrobiia bacterium]|nr:hypothetical protein [Acidimicrobiia bacterium]